jgi:threonine dehydratase
MPQWPIRFADVLAARERLRPFLPVTPLRSYPPLDAAVGAGIRVLVKHENHQPTNAFKVRNGVAVLTALSERERGRGAVAASRGNHGLGLAWAGARLGVPVTVCVPVGNNPEKNEALRGLRATLVEEGRDYDESVVVATRLARERDLFVVHSTNDPRVLAGAATMALEMLDEAPELEALVLGVGGGSQAVGALTAVKGTGRSLEVFGVQAQGAATIHDSWHAGKPLAGTTADTFADGLATRNAYALTFDALRQGLADFVAVTDGELAKGVRTLLSTTHNLVEGAGAAGLAGLLRLRERLAGRTVGIVLSGANIDQPTLCRILSGEL